MAAAAHAAHSAGDAFADGIAPFSGSLCFYGLFGGVPLPGLAPAGGVALMAGWVCLGVAAVRRR